LTDNETDADLNPDNPETAAKFDALDPGTTTKSEEHPRRERRAPR